MIIINIITRSVLLFRFLYRFSVIFILPLLQVFDYDWGLQDDFIGAAHLDMTQLNLGT